MKNQPELKLEDLLQDNALAKPAEVANSFPDKLPG